MRLDGTLAELVDNAGDAGATRVDIDCDDAKIIVADNGCGCDAAGIGALGGHRTSTRTDASERFTGKFGQAFTRAVLSLGDTCTVISYQGLVFHVGLLSKKLQIESNTRECLLPVASFRYPSGYEDVVVEVVEDDDGQLWNKGSLIFERLIKANLENILAYGCADTKDALVALANKYRRANGLVIIVSDLDKRVVPCQADKTIYFKQSEGQRSKTRDDVYPYRQDARHALGWQYVVCSGAADQLPEEYKELAVAPRRPTITLCGQELEAVDIAPERRSSGPVVSNGMEVKEIRFDRRKAAAVTIFTHSLDVEAPAGATRSVRRTGRTGSSACASARRRARRTPSRSRRWAATPRGRRPHGGAGRSDALLLPGRGASLGERGTNSRVQGQDGPQAPYRLRGEGSHLLWHARRAEQGHRGEVRAREEEGRGARRRRRRRRARRRRRRRASTPRKGRAKRRRRRRLGRRRSAGSASPRRHRRRPSRASARARRPPRRASRSASSKLWIYCRLARCNLPTCTGPVHPSSSPSATARLRSRSSGATTTTPPQD